MSTTEQYLRTLRRIPDETILAMAARDLNVFDGPTCVCGWAMRETLGAASNTEPEAVNLLDGDFFLRLEQRMVDRFGGTVEEWERLYYDIADYGLGQLVEEAFVTRVMEAAGVA